MAARSVCCRAGRSRAPPVSSRRGAGRVAAAAPAGPAGAGPGRAPRPARWPAAARPAGGRSRPRAARSSAVEGEVRPGRPGPLDEQAHRLGCAASLGGRGGVRVGSGSGQRGHRALLLAGEAQHRPAGGQHLQPAGQAAGTAATSAAAARAPARSCPAPAAGAGGAAWSSQRRSKRPRPAPPARPALRRPRRAPGPGSRSGASATKPDPVREGGRAGRPRPAGPGGSCPIPPAPVSVTSRTSGRSRRLRPGASSASRPTSGSRCTGRLWGRASSDAQRREVGRQRRGAASWKTRSGRARSLRRCVAQVAQAAPPGRASRTSSAVAPESSTWPPWAAAVSRAQR